MGLCCAKSATKSESVEIALKMPPYCIFDAVIDSETRDLVMNSWVQCLEGQTKDYRAIAQMNPNTSPLVYFHDGFFIHLKSMTPDIKDKLQSRMFVRFLKLFLFTAEEPNDPNVKASLEKLAVDFNSSGFDHEKYTYFGLALFEAVRKGLGAITLENKLRAAWIKVYSRMLQVMMPIVNDGLTAEDVRWLQKQHEYDNQQTTYTLDIEDKSGRRLSVSGARFLERRMSLTPSTRKRMLSNSVNKNQLPAAPPSPRSHGQTDKGLSKRNFSKRSSAPCEETDQNKSTSRAEQRTSWSSRSFNQPRDVSPSSHSASLEPISPKNGHTPDTTLFERRSARRPSGAKVSPSPSPSKAKTRSVEESPHGSGSDSTHSSPGLHSTNEMRHGGGSSPALISSGRTKLTPKIDPLVLPRGQADASFRMIVRNLDGTSEKLLGLAIEEHGADAVLLQKLRDSNVRQVSPSSTSRREEMVSLKFEDSLSGSRDSFSSTTEVNINREPSPRSSGGRNFGRDSISRSARDSGPPRAPVRSLLTVPPMSFEPAGPNTETLALTSSKLVTITRPKSAPSKTRSLSLPGGITLPSSPFTPVTPVGPDETSSANAPEGSFLAPPRPRSRSTIRTPEVKLPDTSPFVRTSLLSEVHGRRRSRELVPLNRTPTKGSPISIRTTLSSLTRESRGSDEELSVSELSKHSHSAASWLPGSVLDSFVSRAHDALRMEANDGL